MDFPVQAGEETTRPGEAAFFLPPVSISLLVETLGGEQSTGLSKWQAVRASNYTWGSGTKPIWVHAYGFGSFSIFE